MSSKIEFAVQMKCVSCSDEIKNKLKKLNEVEDVSVNLEQGSVVVQTTLPSSVIQEAIESAGRKAVLKGFGGRYEGEVGAVAIFGGQTGFGAGSVKGVVRVAEVDDSTCVVEGTIDGLTPGKHGLHVHQFGDISDGCESVGEHFSLTSTPHGAPWDAPTKRHTGDLGNIEAGADGRAVFRLTDRLLKVADIIGRSIVVTEGPDDLGRGATPSSKVDGNSGRRLACGVLSRSAGVFGNAKKICACDGVTLWDERERATPPTSSL